MRLPPLTALRFFYAVGKSTSIRKAAAELNVTHTAVVRQIRALEAWFGASLVETTASGTTLNAQGRRLHVSVEQAFNLISSATAEIRPPGQMGELRVCSAPGFATFWILPRLHLIQRAIPNVAIRIIPYEATHFDKNEVDIEVTFGRRNEADLMNIELVRPRFLVLASSEWIDRNPMVKSAEDLLSVDLVHERSQDLWRSWFEALGLKPAQLSGPSLGALPVVLEAVHLHQGPGIFADIFFEERLTRGNLRQVVPEAPRLDSYVMVARKERMAEPAIKRFAEWIQASSSMANSHG